MGLESFHIDFHAFRGATKHENPFAERRTPDAERYFRTSPLHPGFAERRIFSFRRSHEFHLMKT
jgi:hypothetical protein